jgi:hypothetical protein
MQTAKHSWGTTAIVLMSAAVVAYTGFIAFSLERSVGQVGHALTTPAADGRESALATRAALAREPESTVLARAAVAVAPEPDAEIAAIRVGASEADDDQEAFEPGIDGDFEATALEFEEDSGFERQQALQELTLEDPEFVELLNDPDPEVREALLDFFRE